MSCFYLIFRIQKAEHAAVRLGEVRDQTSQSLEVMMIIVGERDEVALRPGHHRALQKRFWCQKIYKISGHSTVVKPCPYMNKSSAETPHATGSSGPPAIPHLKTAFNEV